MSLPTTEIGASAALHIMEKINNPSAPPVREIIHCEEKVDLIAWLINSN